MVVPHAAGVAKAKVVGHGEATGDGPALVDLGHHRRFARDDAVRGDVVLDVLLHRPAVRQRVAAFHHTVLAQMLLGALISALGAIVGARLVRQALLQHVFVHVSPLSAVAAVAEATFFRAVKQDWKPRKKATTKNKKESATERCYHSVCPEQ